MKTLDILWFVLFLFVSCFGWSQDVDRIIDQIVTQADEYLKEGDREKLDSVAQYLITLSESQGDDYHLNYGYYLRASALSRSNPTLGLENGRRALVHFRNQEDHSMTKLLSNIVGVSLSINGNHMEAIPYLEESLELSKNEDPDDQGNKRFRSRTTYNLSNCYMRKGALDKTGLYLTEAHELAIMLKDSQLIAAVLHQYGRMEYERKDFAQALKYYKDSYEVYKVVSPRQINYPLMSIGMSFHDLGQVDSALYYYHKAIEHDREVHNMPNLCSALSNCAELYLETGRYQKALSMGEELFTLAHDLNLKQHKVNAGFVLGKIYMQLEDFPSAIKSIEEGKQYIDEDAEYSLALQFYQVASDIEEQSGNYKNALAYNKLYKQYSDSILNHKTLSRVDELRLQFDSEQKNQKIEQLEKEKALIDLAFKQKLLIYSSLIIGLVLLSIVIYLILNRRRIQVESQKNRIEQKLLRSQMNPHFIFNAISSIQNYLYDKNDLKVALSYMSKFATLMRQILENSREEHVTLRTEMASLVNYLELQQLRYNNSFGYELIIDSDIDQDNMMVPPLIAQPFVENAIEHGMIYRVENGKVIIAINSNANNLTMVIKDNGLGAKQMNIESKNVEHKKKSLATIITRDRLSHISKANKRRFNLIVDTIQSGGTIVTIQLPKILAA